MKQSVNEDACSEVSDHSQSVQHVSPNHRNASSKVLLLHGNLDILVKEAKNLPNRDVVHKYLAAVYNKISGNSAHNLQTSDPYVKIAVSDSVIGRTFVISNCENPVWNQHFCVHVAHYAAEVHFVVKDNDVVGSKIIGVVAIPVEQLLSGEKIKGTYRIIRDSGKPWKTGAVLSLSIQFIPMETMTLCNSGVPGTYFPLRKGGKVTLYQDAHVHHGFLPNLTIDHDMQYKHGNCWRDIFDAINQARRLIYITGWSVDHLVRLVRRDQTSEEKTLGDLLKSKSQEGVRDQTSEEKTLGDLLKSKSQEGVRVLLLVWNDPTSYNLLGYQKDGKMQTSDEELRQFFKHSSVTVLLCYRSSSPQQLGWLKKQEARTIYSHHQKTVIVDADAGHQRRKIIAFLGGFDLCKGRYDTTDHSPFRTLETVHRNDYHNPNFKEPVVGCPREPWHDLHCQIDGPAAYDILTNFEDRWKRAAELLMLKKLKKKKSSSKVSPRKMSDDALLAIERISDIIGIEDLPCLTEDDPEAWDVQVFRSIDSNSVKGFPKDPSKATDKNLVCGKNVLIDNSIHAGYVNAIRGAQRYIYIENQYFLGSSYNWNNHKTLGANNLIPMEIALKIAQKIKAKERFSVYIVIPMWPEGDPTSFITQRILFWQYNTMQMMYQVIYKALEEAGLQNNYKPQDYLNFFCLGNREATDRQETTSDAGNANAENTPQKTRH